MTPPRPSRLFVLSNIGDRGEFRAEHGRFKTDEELDSEERSLFTSGEAQPGDRVDRIVRPHLRAAAQARYSSSAYSDVPVGCQRDQTP